MMRTVILNSNMRILKVTSNALPDAYKKDTKMIGAVEQRWIGNEIISELGTTL
jgi:hypothetical protein